MTTTPAVQSAPRTAPGRLLALDGGLCLAMGAVLTAAAAPVADLIGTASTGVVRAVGIALVLYALVLGVAARSRAAASFLTTAGWGNLVWEVGSLAVAVLADLSGTGRALVAAQGLVVGALGLAQLRARR